MKKQLMMSAFVAVSLLACGQMPTPTPDAGTNPDAGSGNDFSTAAKILAYLEGKSMVMTGTDIPSHPNGFNENLNFGANTQCYHKVTISTLGGNFQVASDLGTFNSIPDAGIAGMCDRSTRSNTASFTSSAVLIENVKNNGECFDITATYTGFKQEGRGSISADGKTVTLELFFAATGHRCADGAVGATGVQLATQAGPVPFTGNAKQVYRVP